MAASDACEQPSAARSDDTVVPAASTMGETVEHEPCTSLQSLPPELLQVLWRSVGNDLRDQHSLRCTCKALKAASAPLIQSLAVGHAVPGNGGIKMLKAAAQHAVDQLAKFPRDATLKGLTWQLTSDAVLPPGVPSTVFMHDEDKSAPESRLQALRRFTLKGNMVLDTGDISSIISMSPQLQHLTLDGPTIDPRALEPLHLAHSLRLLTLDNLSIALAGLQDSIGPSLASLTNLLALSIGSGSPFERQGVAAVAANNQLCMADVVPHITGLTKLQRLSLVLKEAETNLGSTFALIGRLTQLAYLRYGLPPCRGGPPDADILRPTPADLAGLASLTQLQVLWMRDAELQADSIKTLVSMTRIEQLGIGYLCTNPDEDLSGLPCRWQRLILEGGIGSPQELLRLPLGNLCVLAVGSSDKIIWAVDAQGDLPTQARALRRACEILARTWVGSINAQVQVLHVQWNGPQRPGRTQVLEALAPLHQRRHQHLLVLSLHRGWDPDASDIRVLDDAIPSLGVLAVGGSGANFCSCMAEAATRMPQLKMLTVASCDPAAKPLTVAHRTALMAMAMARSVAGLPLGINCYRGMSEKDRRSCNVRLDIEARRRREAKSVVRFSI